MSLSNTEHPPTRIRDHIRAVIAERGDTIWSVERELGISKSTLNKFLRGLTLTFRDDNCERIASYLGLSPVEVQDWMQRDAERIRTSQVAEYEGIVEEPALTWWGPVRERVEYMGCERCDYVEECREFVLGGGPMLCERMIERDVITESELESLQPEAER